MIIAQILKSFRGLFSVFDGLKVMLICNLYRLTLKVIMTLKDGFFLQIPDGDWCATQKVWVPRQALGTGWAISPGSVSSILTFDGEVWPSGDPITVKVSAVDYSRTKATFQCIGSLKGLSAPKK